MKYRILSISTLFLFFPLFAFAGADGELRSVLTTYSSSEVSTGALRVGAGRSASSGSESASASIQSILRGDESGGVTRIEIRVEKDGVVRTESVQKSVSSGTQVFVATTSSDGSAHAVAQVLYAGTGSTSAGNYTTSSPPALFGAYRPSSWWPLQALFDKRYEEQSKSSINHLVGKLFGMFKDSILHW